ncbi:hypothetical protein D3C73_1335770 [compost metagenome]
MDRSSVEAFAGGGQAVITDLIFPEPDSTGVDVYADEEMAFLTLEIYWMDPQFAASGVQKAEG